MVVARKAYARKRPRSGNAEQPTLVWLSAEVEAELGRIEDAHQDAEHWHYWQELSLLLDALPTIHWQMRQGVFVSDVARWVRLALARARAQQRLYGVFWMRSPVGQALIDDFAALRAYPKV